MALYGVNQLMDAVGYWILLLTLLRHEGPDSLLAKAIGHDFKGYGSLAVYALAIPAAFVQPLIAIACYVLVALVWLIPDRRIERALKAI